MIIINLDNFSWGTAEVPNFPNARRINLLDDDSSIRFTVVYEGSPLKVLVEELIPGLTPEQAAELLPLLEKQTVPTQPPTDGENVVDAEAVEE